MDVPKRIEKLIHQRCRYAELLRKVDYDLSVWLEKNEIKVDEYDIYGGCEVFHNPRASADRIRKAIEEK